MNLLLRNIIQSFIQFFISKRAVYSTLSLVFIVAVSSAANISFSGNSLPAITLTADKNTGLDNIYVLYQTTGVRAAYECSDPAAVKWYRYSNLGGGYAQEVTDVTAGDGVSIINRIEGDSGYIIEDNGSNTYIWIVGYEPHRFWISEVHVSDESDCDITRLETNAEAGPIHYYTINGQQRTLSREIHVSFDNQKWDEGSKSFVTESEDRELEYIEGQISLTPPVLSSTYFTVIGDRFLEEWNWLQQAESAVTNPIAVEVHAEAIQQTAGDDDVPSNEIKQEGSGLGGSAPADIEFRAYTTQGVVHHEWQMSRDPEFNDVEYRFNQQDLDYTFTEEGTFYLRYIGSNSDGSCESVSDTFTVGIGASQLKCPNAFSPNDDGVNDEWKVSYRSLIEFDCWIFDRQGHQIVHLDSPDKGWDGKRHGKTVKPGVYYYVIRALGADGIKYKESGDINILTHKSYQNNSGSATE